MLSHSASWTEINLLMSTVDWLNGSVIVAIHAHSQKSQQKMLPQNLTGTRTEFYIKFAILYFIDTFFNFHFINILCINLHKKCSICLQMLWSDLCMLKVPRNKNSVMAKPGDHLNIKVTE